MERSQNPSTRHRHPGETRHHPPHERIIEYQAPFTRCDRETDYATVWAALDAKPNLSL